MNELMLAVDRIEQTIDYLHSELYAIHRDIVHIEDSLRHPHG